MRKSYKRQRVRNKNKELITSRDEYKSGIITVSVVFICFGLILGLTLIMSKKGVFDKGYEAPQLSEATIDYKNIPIGTIFGKKGKEYYVLFDDYSYYKPSTLLNTLADSYDKTLYKVDMSNGFNKDYTSNKSNKKARNLKELAINGPTLIRIKNGKIDLYLEGVDNIAEFLEK